MAKEKQDCEHSEADPRQSLIRKSAPSFTVTEAIESAGFSKFQYVLCAICGLSWVASAMEIMLLAILSPSLQCEWQLTDVEQALCTTFVFGGWMASSPIWGRICDVKGRRWGLMAASAVGTVFGILTAFAPSFYFFLAARIGVGFAVGGQAQSITLTSEFLPASSRAKWLIVLKSFWAIGAMILTGLAVVILPALGWRWLVACAAIPFAFFGLCCWWLPESVRYDVAQGKIVEARATLDRIAKFNGKALPDGELIVETEESNSSMMDLLKPLYRRTTLLQWGIWMLFGMLYYGTAIYTSLLLHSPVDQCGVESHVTDETAASSAATAGCRQLTTDNCIDIIVTTMSEVPGYFLTMYAVDAIGCRLTFVIGFAIYSACSTVLAFCVPRLFTVSAIFIGRSAVAAVYQGAYIYPSEVYPTSLRGQGLGVASAMGRFGTMMTSVITQLLFTQNFIFPAIFFSVLGVIGAILSILLPTEKSRKAAKVLTSE